MKKDLWKDCLVCKAKCCYSDIAFPLFATPKEKKIINF